MATSTGPDLAPARVAVERLMDDTCRITRNPEGYENGALDQETGDVEDPDDGKLVYNGKCSLRSSAAGVNQVISVPLDAPELQKGDRVVMTSTRRDPSLKGQRFWVKEPLYSTMAVSRRAMLTDPGEGYPS